MCWLGFHDWEKWEYQNDRYLYYDRPVDKTTDPDEKVEIYKRTCEKCGIVKYKEVET